MTKTLSQVLAEQQVRSLIEQANIVREWEPGCDRQAFALTVIREAQVLQATGRISDQILSQVCTTLSFAIS